jgi:hypothetical protein
MSMSQGFALAAVAGEGLAGPFAADQHTAPGVTEVVTAARSQERQSAQPGRGPPPSNKGHEPSHTLAYEACLDQVCLGRP